MKVLVDTSGWIEWLVDGRLAEKYEPYFAAPENLIVPTSIQYELYKWAKRERDETAALETIALTELAEVVPITTSISIAAADLATEHQLSFPDALVYAIAQKMEAELITSEGCFEYLPGVTFHSPQLFR